MAAANNANGIVLIGFLVFLCHLMRNCEIKTLINLKEEIEPRKYIYINK